MDTELSIIIFSKDRACQLDALLRSIYLNVKIPYEVHIIYKASNQVFECGYEGVWMAHPADNIYWHVETDFKRNLDNLLGTIAAPYTVFMVDDMIVKREIAKDKIFLQLESPDVLGISLRLGRDIDADAIKKGVNVPMNSQNLWRWKDCSIKGWNYPMSLDGTIFKTSDIQCIKKLEYKKPNSLESAMSRKPLGNPLMVCYDKAKTVNLAINRVQNEVKKNHCGDITEKFLNDKWLAGQQICLKPLIIMKHNQRHIIVASLTFEDWHDCAPKNNTY